jgi:CDP-3, 6-dideoxy-D-glycero-L-glycero-4-hexulose-4-reductase
MNACCFITGGTGYIGSHVAKHFVQKGWKVCLIVRKQSNLSSLDDILSQVNLITYDSVDELIGYYKKYRPEVTIHIAAAVITRNEKEHVAQLIQSNVQFGTEILEAMRHSDCKLFVNTGTNWQNYNSDIYNPVDLYSATKEAFEKIIQLYVDAFGVHAVTLRLFDVFGEDDKRPKLWNLLRDIAGTAQSIAVSPGEQLIDLVHIKDVCTAYEAAYKYLLIHPNTRHEVFAVQSGQLHSLKQLIGILQEEIGKPIHVEFGGKAYKDREVMWPMAHYQTIPDWNTTLNIKDMFNLFNNSGGVKIPYNYLLLPQSEKAAA